MRQRPARTPDTLPGRGCEGVAGRGRDVRAERKVGTNTAGSQHAGRRERWSVSMHGSSEHPPLLPPDRASQSLESVKIRTVRGWGSSGETYIEGSRISPYTTHHVPREGAV